MTYSSLAIIGTAGRKEDRKILTNAHYERMYQAVKTLLIHLDVDLKTIKVFSGGAAWADHLVVTLGMNNVVRVENITLYLPSLLTLGGYDGDNEWSKRTANTANFYHELFSQVTQIQSIQELNLLRSQGATLIDGTGDFKARNTKVAKSLDQDGILLAFTFGAPDSSQPEWTIRQFDCGIKAEEAGLKDGGSADTWNKSICSKFHCRIGVNA